MKFSYSLSKRFYFHILVMQFFIIHSVSSMNLTNEYLNHKCLNQGKYNSGSAFEKNLNWIFHHITTNSYAATGSAEASIGHTTTPDFVSVIFQCRGDSYGSKCRTCADTAIAGFRKKCPSNKGVIIWYDQCLLYISTIKEKGLTKINYKNIFSMHNPNNVRGDAKLFAMRVVDFFSELTLQVDKISSNDYNHIFYAAGDKKLGKNKVYAMVQCTDVTLDCKNCLAWSITKLFKNNIIKQGARILGTNCDVRYELYPFLRS
ncbi:cysteine-rich repeat secretory protein 34-like [Raphanus sativus]|uniref:Cysteine-rich repeat secretory protein 34-like n=1 Tax=Raphanus sativus TaxID=3726 RepID=A0A6J0NN57_RAPSA|nr:cysteine-rich repeat secretory protein 34-like [Raphanus sativus]